MNEKDIIMAALDWVIPPSLAYIAYEANSIKKSIRRLQNTTLMLIVEHKKNHPNSIIDLQNDAKD